MKSIWIICKNTFREIIRDRILYGLIVFAILLIGFSLALGQLSFAEQSRISANFGFTAIHLSVVILAIFVGSTLVRREIEKKTIFTLLARPISRTQFLIGKYFGLLSVIGVSILLLSLVLSGIFFAIQVPFAFSFLVGIWGVFLEAAILLAITIFFGSFSSPMLSVAFVLAIFLVGHWVDTLQFFSKKSDSPLFVGLCKIIENAIPNLELLNWRSLFVYNDAIPTMDVATHSLYALVWSVFAMSLAAVILQRRDLG